MHLLRYKNYKNQLKLTITISIIGTSLILTNGLYAIFCAGIKIFQSYLPPLKKIVFLKFLLIFIFLIKKIQFF